MKPGMKPIAVSCARKLAVMLLCLLGSGGCLRVPAEIRAELEPAAESGPNHYSPAKPLADPDNGETQE